MIECYECGELALELSNTGRCMKCMESRLKFNEACVDGVDISPEVFENIRKKLEREE